MAELILLDRAARPSAPQPDIVAALDALLTAAKEGRLRGVGVFAVYTAGDVTTDWAGDACQLKMVAGASILQHRIAATAVDIAESRD